MREKWINLGMEDDEQLRPYIETCSDVLDPVRIGNITVVVLDITPCLL